MKKLSAMDYRDIGAWMHRNARELELALWRYHFEGGAKGAVLSALRYYQNEDGGFGNLIDPDNWNPASTPYGTQYAVRILRQLEFTDLSHPLYQGILHYLVNTKDRSDAGWHFTIPSNDGYPHAAWWSYNPEANAFQNIGITAILSGFILRHADKGSQLYEIALSYTDMLISELAAINRFGDIGIKGYCALLEDIEAAGLCGRFDRVSFRERVSGFVNDAIRRDVGNFMTSPSKFIRDPQSMFYPGNEAHVATELDEWIEKKPEAGVWDIPWDWGDEGLYAGEFAISANWSKAIKAIEKLLYLRVFGRLER